MMCARYKYLILVAAAFAISFVSLGNSYAEDYPTRPIRIVVPYTPGGAVDILARVLAQKLTSNVGWQFVVDNRPGASGNIGAESVARSAPDGYTFLLSTSTPLTTNLALYKSIHYQTERDFEPVAQLGDSSVFIVASPKLPFRSMSDFIAFAKTSPDTLSVGTAGHGTLGHFLTTRLNAITGGKIVYVPYRGGLPVVTAVSANEIPLGIADSVAALPFIKGGQVRALATSARKRSAGAPDVPTLAEMGLTDLSLTVWIGCMAPKGTPPDILKKVNTQLQVALKDTQVQETMLRLGIDPIENVALDDFAEFVRKEIVRWRTIVKDSGITVN